MKRKLPLLLSAAYAPAAYGAPSPERADDEIFIDDDAVPLLELPTADVTAEVTVDKSGSAAVQVREEQILAAVQSVVQGGAVSVRIIVSLPEDAKLDGAPVNSVSVSLPREALLAIGSQTGAEAEIDTDIGQITLPNAVRFYRGGRPR